MNNGDPGEPGSLTEERAERLTRPGPGHPAAVPVRCPCGDRAALRARLQV